mgnify:CR=1 FL=1
MDNENKIKVLLIDDDEMIRIYFQDIFWIHGLDNRYELVVINDVKKAEEIINNPSTKPNIVFMDLVMPIEKDGKIITTPEAGLDLLKKIKSDEQLKKIKVVVFSGHDEESIKNKVKKLGAENYLIKGSSLPRELVEFIDKIASSK